MNALLIDRHPDEFTTHWCIMYDAAKMFNIIHHYLEFLLFLAAKTCGFSNFSPPHILNDPVRSLWLTKLRTKKNKEEDENTTRGQERGVSPWY